MDRNRVYAVLSAVWGVALRKESVDRNWESPTRSGPGKWVALRKESVDRNGANIKTLPLSGGRSPQGERG